MLATCTQPSKHIQKLKERYREIARRLVAGQSKIDIAMDLKMSTQQVSLISNSPIFKQLLDRMQDQRDDKVYTAIAHLKKKEVRAAEVITDIMEDREVSPKTRLAAADKVLGYLGIASNGDYKGAKSITQINQYNNLTFEEKMQLADNGFDAEEVLDTAFESEEEKIPHELKEAKNVS